ncbi:hypothetical protein [Paenibacillus shenyangensis]|uniref:hypothetical protein n=1 Tax=Paenibacillus sp. A9 TaxID=1284352 RepID=UPI0003702094|nr:hypothetical protein [Paenibacillus sp. A9]
MKSKHKPWITVLIGTLIIGGTWLFFKNDKPSTAQLYYNGMITKIKKLDSNIDGAKLYYWITLDDGSGHAVTKNSTFFINTPMPFGTEGDPSTKYTKVREEADFSNIKVGNKVEIWDRYVNEHAYEIYELQTLDLTQENK